ncbi:hypothetical protein BGY98DRAFT_1099995 [Russula aff. rugulosa BPL654]|nr:hypothetical protein BGY98DRAFT_1099995 [Russula aff. rugulosa BPL654]
MRHHIFQGVGNQHFLLVLDAVPTLLHLSVFLFFAGLLILLRHISHTVFNAVVGQPTLWADFFIGMAIYVHVLHPLFVSPVKDVDVPPPAPRLLKRLEAKAEEVILGKAPKLDAEILDSLLVTLGEDGAREKFFEAVPGFYGSEVVKDVNKKLTPTFFTNFRRVINQFLDQTLASDSISESVRSRRLLTCLNATRSVLGGLAGMSITDKIICRGNWNKTPPSPEIGHILRHWLDTTDSSRALIASCIIARIIGSVEKRDDTWMALARSQLGATEEGLQFEGILRSIAEFNVKETLPELQRDFCKLWNEMVSVEKSKNSINCTFILGEICHIHDALHPSAPTAVAALPTSATANYDSLLIGSSYALCPDPQSHQPPNASRQVAAVATSSSSFPRGVQPLSLPLQRDETNIINPHLVLDTPSSFDPISPPHGLPVEFRTHVPPALGYSYSSTTSHILTTPRDVSVSDPDIFVDAGERDVQDLNAHDPHQSDPPVRYISIGSSRPEKSVI